LITEDAGLENTKLDMLGKARRINITKDNTTVLLKAMNRLIKSSL